MGQCTSKQETAAVVASTNKEESALLSSTSTSDNLSIAEARTSSGRASATVRASLKDGSTKEMTECSKSVSAHSRASERKRTSMKNTSSNELAGSSKSTSAYRRSMKRSSSKRTNMKDESSNEMRESSRSASTPNKQKRRLSIDNIEKVAEAPQLSSNEPVPSLSVVALTPAPKSRGRSMRTLPGKKVNNNRSDGSPPPLGKMSGAARGARTSIQICEIGKPSKPSLNATKESSWFKLSCSNDVNGGDLDDSYKHNDSQSSMQSSSANIVVGGDGNTPVAGALCRNKKNALTSMVGICFTDSDDEDVEDDSDSDNDEDIEDDMPRIRELVPTSELLLRDAQESELPASWVH